MPSKATFPAFVPDELKQVTARIATTARTNRGTRKLGFNLLLNLFISGVRPQLPYMLRPEAPPPCSIAQIVKSHFRKFGTKSRTDIDTVSIATTIGTISTTVRIQIQLYDCKWSPSTEVGTRT